MSEFDSELERTLRLWSSDERHQRSKSKRIASTVHQQLATEEARFSGLLLDLAENKSFATVILNNGNSYSGNINAVGKDFCAIKSEVVGTCLIHIDAITAVQVESEWRSFPTPSNRTIPEDAPELIDVVAELVPDRPRLGFVLYGDSQLRSGELFATGSDVVMINTGTPSTHVMVVPVDQFSELRMI